MLCYVHTISDIFCLLCLDYIFGTSSDILLTFFIMVQEQ